MVAELRVLEQLRQWLRDRGRRPKRHQDTVEVFERRFRGGARCTDVGQEPFHAGVGGDDGPAVVAFGDEIGE